MLQQIINYLKNVIESYAIIYYYPDYNNHNLANNEHFFDDSEYKIIYNNLILYIYENIRTF